MLAAMRRASSRGEQLGRRASPRLVLRKKYAPCSFPAVPSRAALAPDPAARRAPMTTPGYRASASVPPTLITRVGRSTSPRIASLYPETRDWSRTWVRPSQSASGGKSETSSDVEMVRIPLGRFHGDLRDLARFGSGSQHRRVWAGRAR
jgi:hypothetical protein